MNQNELKKVLKYDKETGLFSWVKNNKTAGSYHNGYIRIRVNNKGYYAHRLAFLYVTGEYPINECDHINRERADNKWSNLRDVSHIVNGRNKSGITGIQKEKGKWRARGYGYPAKSLGYFDYYIQACAARWEYEALAEV